MRKAASTVVFAIMALAQQVEAADIPFDEGWRFMNGDAAEWASPAADDSGWKRVDLPHDWSIAGPIGRDNPSGHAGGFFPTGVGWYRKTFEAPADWKGQRVAIEFDGSSMNTEVTLNGQKLGGHISGFSPFDFDLTEHLKFGERNTIAVRVDHSRQPSARWYVGSGIYRHVRLVTRDPVHLARFGAFITTPEVSAQSATVDLALEVVGAGAGEGGGVECATQIFLAGPAGAPAGDVLAVFRPAAGKFEAGQKSVSIRSQATLPAPKLWSPESPTLYVAVTTVSRGGRVVDTRRTTFGVRTIEASAERGFLLNGKSIEMYGACVHEDNGGLGVAAFDRAIERRVEALKRAGFNAVRCAHNPPAPAFLDACDRLGLLVINEAFDTWSLPKNRGDFGPHFKERWRDELDRMILRDRNHPSIVIWSVGNEVMLWGRQTAQSLAEGTELARRTKELDPTRMTTTAVAGWNLRDGPWAQMEPLLTQFDVVGYNYAIHRYESDHARFPKRAIVGTESFPRDMFAAFDTSDRLAHVFGDFVWTGIDYMGESGIGQHRLPDEPVYFHLDTRQFPTHAASCGDIDITGFRKPISYARNITWGRGETLYTSVAERAADGRKMKLTEWAVYPSRASWTWPGLEGERVEVQVYSRHDAVRLYHNGALIGEKPTTRAQQFKAFFEVPYRPGVLATAGVKEGKEVERSELRTAGPVAGLRLKADRGEIRADGQDLAYVDVESIDATGAFQPTGDQTVTFSVEGPGSIAAVASGDYSMLQSYQGNQRRLFQGRAQVVVRSSRRAGEVVVRAAVEGLPAVEAKVLSR